MSADQDTANVHKALHCAKAQGWEPFRELEQMDKRPEEVVGLILWNGDHDVQCAICPSEADLRAALAEAPGPISAALDSCLSSWTAKPGVLHTLVVCFTPGRMQLASVPLTEGQTEAES